VSHISYVHIFRQTRKAKQQKKATAGANLNNNINNKFPDIGGTKTTTAATQKQQKNNIF